MVDGERPTFSSLIANRGFRYLWFNQVLVQLAYNTLNFTLLIWVFKLTHSSIAVSALVLAMYLPALVFGIFAGVFVDITDRRKIIIIIDLLLALSFGFFIFIKGSYPLILLNTFLINSLAQFFIPAEGSSIPMLVDKKHLLLANSLFSLTLYGSFMLGFSLAGPVLNFFGINAAFILGVVCLLIAFVVAQKLPCIKIEKINKKFNNFVSIGNFRNMFRITLDEGRNSLRFIQSRMTISASILLLAGFQGVIGVLAVVVSSYMETVLHIHATDASYILIIPLGIGMIVGAWFIGRFAHNQPRRSLVIPAIIIAGLLFLLAGFTPDIASYIQSNELPARILHPRYFFRAPSLSALFAGGAFLLGLVAVTIIIPSQTVLQENTPERIRGKIFSVLAIMMNIIMIIPVILAGVLADIFGPAPILIILGLGMFAMGMLIRRPATFFGPQHLPFRAREFLGLGHWDKR